MLLDVLDDDAPLPARETSAAEQRLAKELLLVSGQLMDEHARERLKVRPAIRLTGLDCVFQFGCRLPDQRILEIYSRQQADLTVVGSLECSRIQVEEGYSRGRDGLMPFSIGVPSWHEGQSMLEAAKLGRI